MRVAFALSLVLSPGLVSLSCAKTGASSVSPSSSGAESSNTEGSDAGVAIGHNGTLAADFLASELVGRPTPTSATVNVVPARDLEIAFDYGTTTGIYSKSTMRVSAFANEPISVVLDGLIADSPIFYRMRWRVAGAAIDALGPERTFHTPRQKGSTFRFTVQADSHLDANTLIEQYHRTLENVLADAPDFHFDLGDTFMTEKHSEPMTDVVLAATDESTVVKRYVFERQHFGIIGHSVPLFLVNGNHDAELGYLFNGSGNDLATWATRARQRYFVNPTPNDFYKGDALKAPVVGERAAWYSFQWGDALFIALDPFWNTRVKPGKDPWEMTLGKAQYDELAQTLATSTATFKFIFIHNLVGGLDGQQRGGVEAVPYFEWGGSNADQTPGFTSKRPGWSMPIHDMLVAAKVTAVFHGHDHVYVHQEKDGIVYQAVPQPSAKNTKNGLQLAADYHYNSGTVLSSAGHLRLTVTSTGVTCEYVRSWLPAAENSTQKNGQIAHRWTADAK